MTVASDENRRPLKSRFSGRCFNGWRPGWPSETSVPTRFRCRASPSRSRRRAFVLTAWTESDVLRRVLWLAGGVCVQLRLCANLLDGLVAVEGGKDRPWANFTTRPTASPTRPYCSGWDTPRAASRCSALWPRSPRIHRIRSSPGGEHGRRPGFPWADGQATANGAGHGRRPVLHDRAHVVAKDLIAEWDLVDFALLTIILGGLVTAVRRLGRIAQLPARQR